MANGMGVQHPEGEGRSDSQGLGEAGDRTEPCISAFCAQQCQTIWEGLK